MKNENYTEIKTLEDALKATGRPEVPAFADAPEDMREYFQAHYKAAVITEAINGDWKADWTDGEQRKYFPWFDFDGPSGFAFSATYCGCSSATAGDASRLCFETREQAAYAGQTFPEVYKILLTK